MQVDFPGITFFFNHRFLIRKPNPCGCFTNAVLFNLLFTIGANYERAYPGAV